MATDRPPEPPKLPGGDPRLDAFLQQAAPIIAVERGINGKSRVKLEALARDLRLPDDLFDQAIHMLQGAPPVAGKSRSRWEEAFRTYLRAKLQRLPNRIITTQVEARAVARGRDKYQLSEEQALDAIREVAAECEIRRISRSAAERHVADVIAKKVGDAEWLDDKTVERLHAVGREWGLSVEQVDAEIRSHTDDNRRRQSREKRNTILLLTAAGVVAVGVLCLIVFIVVAHRDANETPPGDSSLPAATGPADAPRVRSRSISPPKWWNEDLALQVVHARQRVRGPGPIETSEPPETRGFAPIYGPLAADDPLVRGEAYRKLVDLWQQVSDEDYQRDPLDQVLIGCYTLEPDDDAARTLRERLLAIVATGEDQLPTDAKHYREALWAVDLAVEALMRNDLPAARARELELELGRKLGISVDRRIEYRKLLGQCLAALVERYYRQLIAAAPTHLPLAAALQAELSKIASRYLSVDSIERFEAKFVAAVVPKTGQAWVTYRDLIGHCVTSNDPLNVLDMVSLYEESGEPSLQSFMIRALKVRLEVTLDSTNVRDMAFALRQKLGAISGTTATNARDRWTILQRKIEDLVKARRTPARKPEEFLDETIQSAYLATLACALAQQEPGFPDFDRLLDLTPPSVTAAPSETVAPTRPADKPVRAETLAAPDAAKRQKMASYLARLTDFEQQNSYQRLSALRGLAQLTEYYPDVRPDQATDIARYLLAHKSDPDEYAKALEPMTALARWRYLKLAIADQLSEATLPPATAQQLVSAVLGRPLTFDDGSGWQDRIRATLLRDVLKELSVTPVVAGDGAKVDMFDRTAELLYEQYSTRAKLLGLLPSTSSATPTPSAVLQLLIDRSAGKDVSGLSPDDARFVTELPYRLTAVEYLAAGDVRRTVLLQRIWLRLLVREAAGRRPERANAARQLIAGLEQQDARADSLLAQLRDGESVILKVWMLYAP